MLTSPAEFARFYDLLMSNAPEGFKPWFFPVKEGDKFPDPLAIFKLSGPKSSCCNADWIKAKRGQKEIWACSKCNQARCSWKAPHARMSKEQCIERLKQGGNVGIAARANDPLVIIDRDSFDVPDLQKQTLTTRSRSRNGGHWFGWVGDSKIKTNIPTENLGEVRSCDAYVVAPGSYVPIDELKFEKLSFEQQAFAGCYTVEKAISPCLLCYDNLPQIYKDAAEKQQVKENATKQCATAELLKSQRRLLEKKSKGKASGLFDLRISDIVVDLGPRFPHPLHDSETGSNFSISGVTGLAHCYRHNVSLNAIQFLAIKSGKFDCSEIGTGHKKAGGTLPDSAIFWAWHQAKLDGILPKNDPIPTRALKYIAEEHKLGCSQRDKSILPKDVYLKALRIVERDY